MGSRHHENDAVNLEKFFLFFCNLIIRLQVPKLEGGNKARGQSQTAKLLDEWERRGNSNKISENVNQFTTKSRLRVPY